MKITDIVITPIAFHDPPLLNPVGVHEPWALRTIVEVHTDEGISGLGESYGDIGRMRTAAPARIGLDVHALNRMQARIRTALGGEAGSDRHGLTGPLTVESTVNRVFSPFEVAARDVRGKAEGRPVSDLLGGAVRSAVPYSAYLFYRWAGHPGAEPDEFGEARDPSGIVEQARMLIDRHGFGSIKLKDGVHPPSGRSKRSTRCATRSRTTRCGSTPMRRGRRKRR